MTQDRPKIHPKWILITLLSRWGWKNASTLLRRQFFHGIYSVFLHITHPKGCMQHSTKNSKIEQEKRVFFTWAHPRKHAQEAIFPVIYSVFLHISNTDFDPQKSANHRAPPHPPWLPQINVSAFPTLSVITLPPSTPPPWLPQINVSAFPTLSVITVCTFHILGCIHYVPMWNMWKLMSNIAFAFVHTQLKSNSFLP